MRTDYSVLMSVYYKENPEHLRKAMNSMWNQTVPTNDFVLVCDGELTDEIENVIEEMRREHSNFRIVRMKKNEGLGNALRKGIVFCKNELIARMDSDDISAQNRCEKQLELFELDPTLSICSGTIEEFTGQSMNTIGRRALPETNDKICLFSRKRNPFNHPAVMFKKTAVIDSGNYDEKYHLFEDYYLWIRMLQKGYKGANIQDTILFMRIPEDLYMRRGGKQYAKDMLRFHLWIRHVGWSKTQDFIIGAIPHALVCLLPNKMRKIVYRVLHG